ncbi:metalloendoproteinase 4-MMP-like [Apium graveolens]|uniref:metalloendoproteinase 4-MMP-like n=1 Tax=Apium graveolens TaxID=4045 RepID=UPI003D78B51B
MFLFIIFFSLFFVFLHPPVPFVTAKPDPNFQVYTINTPRPAKDHSHKWHNFQSLQNVEKGSHYSNIIDLKKYLHRFGYLAPQDTNFTDAFDDNFEQAITVYQSKLGLSVTGNLNYDTISHIISPRCGVPDTLSRLHRKNNYAYFRGQPRWWRKIPMQLTYAFSAVYIIKSLSLTTIQEVFKRSFGHWSSVIPVTFVEINEYDNADITIGFYTGDHGDGEAFDGVLGILAHAFSPENGKFHLDAAETWAVDFGTEESGDAIDLESVVTHEIGHVLGLAHSSVKESIMYPSLKPRHKKVDLKIDDIKGVQALYGSNPNFRFGESSESVISSGNGNDFRTASWTLRTYMFILMIAHKLCM